MPQNFADNLSQGFAGIKDKAAKLQQSLKVKSRLNDLQKQKTGILTQLGSHALQAYRTGQPVIDEAFAQQAAAIAQLEAETAALEQELAMLEGRSPVAASPAPGAVACPQCGAPNAPGARFCGNCGAPTGA